MFKDSRVVTGADEDSHRENDVSGGDRQAKSKEDALVPAKEEGRQGRGQSSAVAEADAFLRKGKKVII